MSVVAIAAIQRLPCPHLSGSQPLLLCPPSSAPLQALAEGFRSCVWVELPEGWSEHHDPRSKQPYYVNSATGGKQWQRPQLACALVQSTQTSHQQPTALQPRRGSDGETVVAVQG